MKNTWHRSKRGWESADPVPTPRRQPVEERDRVENYAALLRKTGRGDEAERMEARAMAIRGKHAK